ncbi:MAG: N-acetylmuramoyl-L-alanine amidase [Phycisphaeraceae bacterium]|nr:N-acetylmuramoyl-L-alanine amidase [Phycisphaeraceae bacterium]
MRPLTIILFLALAMLPACAARPGTESPRRGDEIMVCGRLFHTGAPVVLWTDPGGYDAYRTERRFVPWKDAAWSPPAAAGRSPETPARYGVRFAGKLDEHGAGPLTLDEFERIRGGGWDLPTLQRVVDQFIIHYDVCGTSRQCFRVLHDIRGLSVHFMLDIDGTIYQTLDLKERAWHATTSNDRAIGIEIANMGAYPPLPKGGGRGEGEDGDSAAEASHAAALPPILQRWYAFDEHGPRITLPEALGDGGVRTPDFVGRPARNHPVRGTIQGTELIMFDLTPEQYDSLIRLTAALCKIFPNLHCDYPRDADGNLITNVLPEERLADYRGLLGHYHMQKNKIDPGPAFDWERVVGGARGQMAR